PTTCFSTLWTTLVAPPGRSLCQLMTYCTHSCLTPATTTPWPATFRPTPPPNGYSAQREQEPAAGQSALSRTLRPPTGTTIGVPATGSGTTFADSPNTSASRASVSTSPGSPSAATAPSFIATSRSA